MTTSQITPAPGWMVDPSNPNGVVPSGTAGTLVKDPTTGAMTLAPGAGSNPLNVSDLGIGNSIPAATPATAPGGTQAAPAGYQQAPGAAPITVPTSTGSASLDAILGVSADAPPPPQGSDPYTLFNQYVTSILQQMQQNSSVGRNNISGAVAALNTSGATASPAYDPTAGPAGNVALQTATLGSFKPEVASLSDQLANANSSVSDFENSLPGVEEANAPVAVSPGQSLVTKGGQTIKQGHSYTPTLNPQTGLMDGFDQNTGTWASQDGGSNSSATSTAIDSIFGAQNPMGSYATDTNYTTDISNLYGAITSTGATSTPDTLQLYINNHAKGAPVTGQMIITAAQANDIDPSLLTTVLQHESDFGTAGVGAKTMNPGNQGNTGTSTQSYNSWSQGVNATAKNIADRMQAAGGDQSTAPQSTAAATSPVGGQFSAAASQKISQLPSAYQSYVDAGPLGVAYINDDRVPDNAKQGLQTLAARAGIPYVQDADVGAIKSIQTVLDNLDSMQKLADDNLSSGLLGRAKDLALGPVNEYLQTDWGQKLGLFDNYRDTAIKAVQALAGGAGSGLRINMGEIAANTQNLPKSTDNLENATANIKQLKQLIYTQLSTTFPYAQVKVEDPNGNTGTLPAGNLNAAIQAGYSVQ